jgi:hypothetical protein
MVRRFTLVALAVCVAVGTSVGFARQVSTAPLTLTGWIALDTAADGLQTVISIDALTAERQVDGLVDHAFRAQHRPGPRVHYVGWGSVAYDRGRLAIATADGIEWTFTVPGRLPLSLGQHPGSVAFDVLGLSHHWGPTVQRSHDEVVTLLVAGVCASAETGPCSNCELGGPGESGCKIELGGGTSCSADCIDGYYACCSSQGCRCCVTKEQ